MIFRAMMTLAVLLTASSNAFAKPAPEASVKLERWRTRWVLPVQVAGKERKLLLDTAGGLTLLSRDVVTEAGCTPWGRLTGFRMFGERGDTGRCTGIVLSAAGYRATPPVVGLIDLGKLNPADAPLDGLASLNMFEGKAITLDFANGILVVESDASLAERVRNMTPLKVRLSGEVQGLALAVSAEVPTAKGPLWMELDSGNGGTVLISKQYADLFGLDPSIETKQKVRFPIVANVNVDTEHAFTPDIIIDGSLGMPFLSNWVITLDLRNGKAWIAPALAKLQTD